MPKILRPLVKFWCPEAFVISFKVSFRLRREQLAVARRTRIHVTFHALQSFSQLETDESILLAKARQALRKYGHSLVIANQLHTRKYKVILVEEEQHEDVTVREDEGVEIELRIVEKVLQKHEKFLSPS